MNDDELLGRVRRAVRGRFDVAGQLGRGGMAVVYLAYDLQLGRKVAIKVMLPELAAIPRMTERFLEEARALARLDHPNVIDVHSAAVEAGLPYFDMRLVEGPSLDRVWRHGAMLPAAAALCIVSDVAHALHHAHTNGVVHRDVKPSNILLTPDGRAVVTDFGIARVLDSEGLTLTGMLVGTPAYMSPEQWTGAAEITGAADQYALGVVAYELFAGESPFHGNGVQLQWAHVHQQASPLLEVCPSCPAAIAAAVMRMLEKSPTARFASLADVISVLEAEPRVDERETRRELGGLAAAVAPETPPNVATPRSPLLPPQLAPVGSLRLSPSVVRLEVGDAPAEVLARLVGEDRRPIPDVQFEWAVTDASIARVDARGGQGHVAAVAPGKTLVTVTVGKDLRRSAEVIVEAKGSRTRKEARSNVGSFTERVLIGGVATALLALARMSPDALEKFFRRAPQRDYAAPVRDQPNLGPPVTSIHRVTRSGEPVIPVRALTPPDQAFGFSVQPRNHPDSGDAAFAFKHLLISMRDHDIARFGALTTGSFVAARDSSRTAAFISRAAVSGVSIRYYDEEFIEAVDRALIMGRATVPFLVVLDDPRAPQPRDRRPSLYFTAIISSNASTRRTSTGFRLDSVASSSASDRR